MMDSAQMAPSPYHPSSIQNLNYAGMPTYPSPRHESQSQHGSLGIYDNEMPSTIGMPYDASLYTSAPHSTHPWSGPGVTAAASPEFVNPSSTYHPGFEPSLPGWDPKFQYGPPFPAPGTSLSPSLSSQPFLSDRSSVSSCEQPIGTYSRESTDSHSHYRPIKPEYPGIQEVLPMHSPHMSNTPLHDVRMTDRSRNAGIRNSIHSSPETAGRSSFHTNPRTRKLRAGPKENTLVPRERRRREFTTEQNAQHKCEVCNKLFQRSYNYKKHMEIHNPNRDKPNKCECGQSFVRPADYKRHLKSVHEKNKDQTCAMCGTGFTRRDTLRRHTEDGCPRRFDVPLQQAQGFALRDSAPRSQSHLGAAASPPLAAPRGLSI